MAKSFGMSLGMSFLLDETKLLAKDLLPVLLELIV